MLGVWRLRSGEMARQRLIWGVLLLIWESRIFWKVAEGKECMQWGRMMSLARAEF